MESSDTAEQQFFSVFSSFLFFLEFVVWVAAFICTFIFVSFFHTRKWFPFVA